MKPYYEDEHVQIWHGDCREVIKTLADSSVDSVVCDPPYELGFMGKGWDRSGIAYDVAVWSECLRVLKPGGHLLAFGGSRTYHRLACAIEDAGFEIRDQIQWIYSSGFPKSLNVSKNLREEESVCICDENGKALSEHSLRSLSDSDISSPLYAQDKSWEVLQPSMSQQGAPQPWATRAEPETSRRKQSGMEGRSDGVQEEGQLYGSALRSSAGMGIADGSQGRIHHGAPASHGSDVRVSSHQNGSSQSQESPSIDQLSDQFRIVSNECRSQAWRGWPHCGRCSKPMVPEGIGSALKPAHEPIVLARKPLTTTLIQNVLQHGTGGLNINGCRIEGEKHGDPERFQGYRKFSGQQYASDDYSLQMASGVVDTSKGRWPANIIHDGSDEVLSGFPQTDNSKASMRGTMGESPFSGIDGSGRNPDTNSLRGHDDNGGSAARFFYCAKSSQEDRNEGLEDLPMQSAGAVTDRKDESAGLNSPRAGAGRNSGSRNPHPTVKPTDLMRYLCRLVTPPNGTVLDPFCGSGSTGKAAVLEGLRFIGVELSAEYCELAQRRIKVQYNRMTLYHLIDTKERQRLLIDA